jgi:DNA-binding transcriptional MerR regulator
MEVNVKAYTVGTLARMAGVSVRTLHYYDEVGLLAPSSRSAAGYRLYSTEDLLRLQQILLFRELELPLEEVADILDDPHFDQVQALTNHRKAVEDRITRMQRLLTTIDRTLLRLTGESMELTDEELYEGLTKEEAERYQREAAERYDPAVVAESNQRIRKMSKAQWQALKAQGEVVTKAIADAMDKAPQDSSVQALVARHFKWIGNFYTVTPQIYRGLSQLYVQNDEFRAFYERVAPGLADFLSAAMLHYTDTVLDT